MNPSPTPGELVSEVLGTLLRRDTRARLYDMLTDGLGPAVDPVTYPVLSGLARTGPQSAAVLAEEIGLDRSVVTRRASRLQEAGLLRREENPRDQRATLLVLTEAGESAIETMRRRLAAHLQAHFDQWPAGQAAAFAESLQRFVNELMDLDS